MPDVDAVLVPVGGGGLIAGIAMAMKVLKPSVKVIVRFLNYMRKNPLKIHILAPKS